MNQYKRIFIVGHPGAGKTLLAKTLAEHLGWQFLDADFGLEFRIGRRLNDVLGIEGEQKLLQCQSEIIANLISKEHIVVATDASIVCSEHNRMMLSSECVVFIKVSTAVQIDRTSRNPVSLLPVADLEAFLDDMHHERDPLFEQVATVSIDSDDNALEEHVVRICAHALNFGEMKQKTGKVQLDKQDSIIFHKVLHIPVHLTEQQAISLKLLAKGQSSKEISRAMNISHRTVEGTIAKTMELLGCTSSKELIAHYHSQH
ncbi:shikimate kinase [Legionella bononiensis]|uniref:Shikimate kinase n=1 Tax=Legionella bononiensis TaxID=2793102 RepID=A0ABS1WDD1_9GAMM|nr:shikimate kinase [Legionella bononiensis]MBL7527360.1 AAA family ATPase [Legionella bononiensis]